MKMTLNIDEALLQRVMDICECDGKAAAVDLALRELERRHKLAAHIHQGLGLSSSELVDAIDPGYDVLAGRNVPLRKTKRSPGPL